ncbi:MAG TPA: M20/M25/M40 family metallo-hydrolase [Gemmatimonadales bacterium]|nr:M20/M25/M40 family metallo-hydrolase [Gemmatimonadales bacterium]
MRQFLLCVVLAVPALVSGQLSHPGFRAPSVAGQAALETRLMAVMDADTMRSQMHVLAARAHVAGTPAQRETAAHVLRAMAGWGLDTSRAAYRVFLPYHDSTIVEVVGTTRQRLSLTEPELAEDPTTGTPQWPAMNGYSGAGDVTAPVVYVNYGLPADYDQLTEMGVEVRGRVVIARYGRSYRGIKAREAEAHGAVALLLYSDPKDDGYVVDEVYPAGPMRSEAGVQRGSLFNGQGDPSTPGRPSLPGVDRIGPEAMAIPHIPVVPIGYGNADRFLAAMHGPSVPEGWQGGLGHRYHLGDGTVQARVAVWPERGERAMKEVINTFGIIKGSTYPDELVIVGAHRDAWGPGALDDVSGTISVLEAARAWGTMLRQGVRPKRTMIFATWDAEEWGLVGSTEWVEEHDDMLDRQAVAYINMDVVAAGPRFGAGGTMSLKQLVHDVTREVPQPRDSVSILTAWTAQAGQGSEPPMLGDLGGGSDFTGFYNHLGIPSIEFGFGGRGGSYHSAYDTWSFVERFADPGYREHVAAAQVAAVLLARFANADIVPFEYGDLGTYLASLVTRSRKAPGADAIGPALDDLESAAQLFATLGARFSMTRNRALQDTTIDEATTVRINAILRQVERTLRRPEGLADRPYLRNLVFAADRDNGYANVQLPTIIEALQDDDPVAARHAAEELAGRVRMAAELLDRARAAVPGAGD